MHLEEVEAPILGGFSGKSSPNNGGFRGPVLLYGGDTPPILVLQLTPGDVLLEVVLELGLDYCVVVINIFLEGWRG